MGGRMRIKWDLAQVRDCTAQRLTIVTIVCGVAVVGGAGACAAARQGAPSMRIPNSARTVVIQVATLGRPNGRRPGTTIGSTVTVRNLRSVRRLAHTIDRFKAANPRAINCPETPDVFLWLVFSGRTAQSPAATARVGLAGCGEGGDVTLIVHKQAKMTLIGRREVIRALKRVLHLEVGPRGVVRSQPPAHR